MVINNMGIAFASEIRANTLYNKNIVCKPLKNGIKQSVYLAMPDDACDIPANKEFYNFFSNEEVK